VTIAETLHGCETILGQTEFEQNESEYYMIGALPEVMA